MTSWTKQRTVTREQLEASRAAWDAGDFGPSWKPWRHLAAMEAGIIVPPSGSRWDQWDDDEPSERALIARAIEETPDALLAVDEEMRTMTFAEFAEEAERAAAGLAVYGVGEGSVVTWQLPTWLESLVLVAALSRLGAVQ